MSMLAGPRRKQKVINLRAKNNAWSNDATKFGQRMLEKMGWSSGKGLGARENGIVEHVVARYKNDEKGLGFEDKNDQWTKHEDDFNTLLANLSNDDSKEITLHSGVSLEEKSKKSKARIHYHKFTRGKDLSRYSEKDLASIFGKKSLKNLEKIEEKDDKLETMKQDQVFTEKGSMEDYFKSKMSALNSKNESCLNSHRKFSKNEEYSFKGFSGTNDNEEIEETHQGFGFQSFSLDNSNNDEKVPENHLEDNISSNKNKKKMKNKNNDSELSIDRILSGATSDIESEVKNCNDNSNGDEPEPNQDESSKKNKKKKKNKNNDSDLSANGLLSGANSNEEIKVPHRGFLFQSFSYNYSNNDEKLPENYIKDNLSSKKSKKKKKSKNKDSELFAGSILSGANSNEEAEEKNCNNNSNEEIKQDEISSKKNKKKRKLQNKDIELTENQVISDNENVTIQTSESEGLLKKKVKKSKFDVMKLDNLDEPKKKKKKKNKEHYNN